MLHVRGVPFPVEQPELQLSNRVAVFPSSCLRAIWSDGMSFEPYPPNGRASLSVHSPGAQLSPALRWCFPGRSRRVIGWSEAVRAWSMLSESVAAFAELTLLCSKAYRSRRLLQAAFTLCGFSARRSAPFMS